MSLSRAAAAEWLLTFDELIVFAAYAAGRIEIDQLRRLLAERGWPESDAAELVEIAAKERRAAEKRAS